MWIEVEVEIGSNAEVGEKKKWGPALCTTFQWTLLHSLIEYTINVEQ